MLASTYAYVRTFVCSCTCLISRVRMFFRASVCADECACVCVRLPSCMPESVHARVRSHLRACIRVLSVLAC